MTKWFQRLSSSPRLPGLKFVSLGGDYTVMYACGLFLAAIAFLLFFVALWCGVCLLMARIGGWSALATRFRAVEEPAGEKFRFCSAKIGIAAYRSAITAVKSDAGLHLSMLALFRLGHPPILIPWSEMKNPRAKRVLGASWVDVTVSTPSMINVRLPSKVVEGKLMNA